MAEWHTRRSQKPMRVYSHEGSTPSPGTKLGVYPERSRRNSLLTHSMVETKRSYQFLLGEKPPETVYRFDSKTVIYPLRSKRGALQNPIFAQKTNKKRWGLGVYVSLSGATLLLDGKYWTMQTGFEFAAYANKAHQIKSTKI